MHHHHFWWRYLPHKELTLIYTASAIRSFALSLMSLFVPLYLYKEMGYGLNSTLYFFLIYSLVFAISTPFAAKFAARFGCKHSVLISVPLYLAFICLLYYLPHVKVPLEVIAFFLGSALAFYWMGLHVLFRNHSDKKHRGAEVGKREGISMLATVVGPVLGGGLISILGFKTVFLLAALLLFSSVFFLFVSKEEHTRYVFSLSSLLDKKHWKNSLFYIYRGCRVMASGVIWPIFIFLILGDYLSLGIIESVLALITSLLIWGVGKYSDGINKFKLVHFVSFFEAISWGLRALVGTTAQIIGITIFGSLTYGTLESPMGALEYDKARKSDVTAYFVHREMFICLGRILMLGIVWITGSLVGGLLFNGLATFAVWLL